MCLETKACPKTDIPFITAAPFTPLAVRPRALPIIPKPLIVPTAGIISESVEPTDTPLLNHQPKLPSSCAPNIGKCSLDPSFIEVPKLDNQLPQLVRSLLYIPRSPSMSPR